MSSRCQWNFSTFNFLHDELKFSFHRQQYEYEYSGWEMIQIWESDRERPKLPLPQFWKRGIYPRKIQNGWFGTQTLFYFIRMTEGPKAPFCPLNILNIWKVTKKIKSPSEPFFFILLFSKKSTPAFPRYEWMMTSNTQRNQTNEWGRTRMKNGQTLY